MKSRRTVVLPVVVSNSPIKPILIILFLANIENIIFFWMSFIQELFYLSNSMLTIMRSSSTYNFGIVTILSLYGSLTREGHNYYSVLANVAQIQIVYLIDVPLSSPAN